jgi:hypothetical protein
MNESLTTLLTQLYEVREKPAEVASLVERIETLIGKNRKQLCSLVGGILRGLATEDTISSRLTNWESELSTLVSLQGLTIELDLSGDSEAGLLEQVIASKLISESEISKIQQLIFRASASLLSRYSSEEVEDEALAFREKAGVLIKALATLSMRA